MTLRLHDYTASGNCYKVRLLLAQLSRPYERVPVDIFGGDTLTGEYARLNPLRQTPVLEPEDGEPISESNAILLYLAEGTEFLPEDRRDRAWVYSWLFFEQAEVSTGIAGLRFRLITERIQADSREAQRRRSVGEAALKVMNDWLERNEYLAGSRYSVADISLFAYVHVAHEGGLEVGGAVREWIERVQGTRGYMNDLDPYPPNAWPGAGRSIYG
jgi:glutathione S-transferase